MTSETGEEDPDVGGTHPDVLEEPRAHDVGGVLGQDAAFVLRGVVVVIEEVQVLVELQLELKRNEISIRSIRLINDRSGDRLFRPMRVTRLARTPEGFSWLLINVAP